jgi:hypothetical protein
MYKNFKITKKYNITFNKFPKTAKDIDSINVYKTGLRNWISDDSYNYSIVLGTFRIIFTIERTDVGCCQAEKYPF